MQDITFYYYCLHHKHIFAARTTFFFTKRTNRAKLCQKKVKKGKIFKNLGKNVQNLKIF